MFSEQLNFIISSVLTVEKVNYYNELLYMQADERMVTVCLLTRDSSVL